MEKLEVPKIVISLEGGTEVVRNNPEVLKVIEDITTAINSKESPIKMILVAAFSASLFSTKPDAA